MISETLKKRLKKDRPTTTITLRIPEDVVASLKEVAPQKGFSGYQVLLKSYISEGLRRDEAVLAKAMLTEKLATALENHGLDKKARDEILHAIAA